ncbi:MAG: hypothetical protein QXI89_00380, partial [Candidatus Anstonellales archaeon]
MEKFSSRLALLLALIGSAVGLGNIWRVSYLFSFYGSAFLISYIVFVIIIGLPLVYLELKLSERYKKPVKELYSIFAKKHKLSFFKYVYLMPLITLFVLSTYYSIVLGQVLTNIIDIHIGSLFLVWAITIYAVLNGIKGIEKVNNVFMLLLFILLLYLLANVKTLPNLLAFETKDIIESIKQGLAHVLFSLSVGTGLLYTYSIYSKKSNTFENAFIVSLSDTLVAIISLIVIFSMAPQPDIFVAFEGIKNKFFEIGQPFLSYVFFLALFSAGITSLIALAKFLYDNGNIYTLLTAFIS